MQKRPLLQTSVERLIDRAFDHAHDYATEQDDDAFAALVDLRSSIDVLKDGVTAVEAWQSDNPSAPVSMRVKADLFIEARRYQLSSEEAAYDMLLQKVAELVPQSDGFLSSGANPSQPCNTRNEEMYVGTESTKETDSMDKLVELRNAVFALERALEAASMQSASGMDVDAIVKYELNAQKIALKLAQAREVYTNALREAALADMQNEAGSDKEAE